ncbi:MAG: DegT/DnrJ/EryC1/StrS family aminotransferase [Candidatus Woesearchaeota archaeon]
MKPVGVGTVTITEQAKKNVMTVLETGRLSYGPFLQKLEKDFAKIHDCKFGIVRNSGTSALHVALQALKEIYNWNDGDEVLVPAVTFVATSNIVIHNKMTPIFVDVEKEYYNIDPKKIEEKITSKTRAIIPVHLFGLPCDMDQIFEIAKKHNLKIIEDSCETMYARYNGKMVGSLSDIGCFSTYIAHLLITGVGGINTTNNPEYATKIRSLINHGRDSIYISIDDAKGKKGEELKEIIEARFRFVSVGHSFRVTEMEGALGVAQLELLPEIIEKRRKNAASLLKHLKPFEQYIQLPKIRPGCDHSFMMFPLVMKNENKKKIVEFLENNHIETREMLPLINQPIYQQLFKINEDDYPITKWINESGFYIGCHQDVTEVDLTHIITIFSEYFKE